MSEPIRHLVQRTEADPLLDDLLEEFARRLETGALVDVEAYVAEHPERGEVLRRMLPVIQMLAELDRPGAVVAPTSPGGPGPQAALGELGDYRILRELGRGGMGVVYEAEQISLGRRVALKVLPFASTLDSRQLQRFKNEAHAAAQLHHTNIVPVHATGCERGVHYYAMQFIDGRTLAELIAELRQRTSRDRADSQRTGPYTPGSPGADAASGALLTPPPVWNRGRPAWIEGDQAPAETAATPPVAALSTLPSPRDRAFYRLVARLGIQAAEALEHAHQLGVLHRDIKPGNLLIEHTPLPLGQRGEGQVLRLWITDFGLAHCQSQAGLTMTGDLLGTLRYMSPEQALAQRIGVDQRTDIYSLGVTLYELLTLEPAFPGRDRQELLRQIAFEESRPPRRLNKVVPAELETIVLKAMEKNSADRYATAQEMADDLERFLKDEPIRARRPTLVQRARKWARRHQAAVWAAGFCLSMTLIVLAASSGWALRDRGARRAAAEQKARAAFDEATRLVQEEKWPEALGAARRAQGILGGVGADPDLSQQVEELARDLEMVRRLDEARLELTALAKAGHLDWQGLHAAYADTFAWYGLDVGSLELSEAAGRIRSRCVRRQLVAGLDDWAAVQRRLGLQGWRPLLAVSRAADPDRWRNRLRDALEGREPKALQEVAASVPDGLPPATALLLSQLSKGTGAAGQALAVLEKVQQQHPADFWVNTELGGYLRSCQPPQLEEAIRYFTAAVALRPQAALAHLNLGAALGDKGQYDQANTQFREAIRLKKDYPSAHYNLGVILGKQEKHAEAEAEFRQALRLRPGDPEVHHNLGVTLNKQGKSAEAEAEIRKALRLRPAEFLPHYNLGNALRDQGKHAEAEAEFREALRLRPACPEVQVDLGIALSAQGKHADAEGEFRRALRQRPGYPEAHSNLGVALNKQGKPGEAETELRTALRLRPAFPEANYNLGVVLGKQGKRAEAEAEYRQALRLRPGYPEAHHGLGTVLVEQGKPAEAEAELRTALRLRPGYAEAHHGLGIALAKQGKHAEAEVELREAIRLRPDYAEAYCNLGLVLVRTGRFRQGVEVFRRGHQLGSRQPRWSHPSAQYLREAELVAQLDDRLTAVLEGKARPRDAAECLAFAQLCQSFRQRYAAAASFFAEAFAEQPALAANLATAQRYNAACCAALAGCGQGKDAAGLAQEERARLRQQALAWLRADLQAWGKLLQKEPDKARPVVIQRLRHWLADADFAAVRGDRALALLPEAERPAWQKLWADVADKLGRAQGKPAREENANRK
jgi:Flp pilus assembly protein TadD/serine/threonine protein kinase